MGRIKINTKTKKAVKESYIDDIDDLGYDVDTELDSEVDVFDAINHNSDQFYGKTDYLDEDGEVIKFELFDVIEFEEKEYALLLPVDVEVDEDSDESELSLFGGV